MAGENPANKLPEWLLGQLSGLLTALDSQVVRRVGRNVVDGETNIAIVVLEGTENQVLDVWAIKRDDTGNVGDNVQIRANGGGAIIAQLNFDGVAVGGVVRATSFDPTINGNLTSVGIEPNQGGAGNNACQVWVTYNRTTIAG